MAPLLTKTNKLVRKHHIIFVRTLGAIVLLIRTTVMHQSKNFGVFGIRKRNGNNKRLQTITQPPQFGKVPNRNSFEKPRQNDKKTSETIDGNTVDILQTFPLEDYRKYPCLKGLPLFSKDKWSSAGKCVRTIKLTPQKTEDKTNCISLKTPRGTTPICTYPAEKDTISKYFHTYRQYWEGSSVRNLANLFKSDPDLEFLDLGCNIGIYTLSIAQQGTRVTSVDPLIENINLLSRSLTLGKLHENVTLIWNAISNEHKIITFKWYNKSIGRTQISDLHLSKDRTDEINLARTITLDDLIPLFTTKRLIIKMDIENSEYNALLGGKRFFDEIDVSLVRMEVILHKRTEVGKMIVDYMSSYNFYPYKDILKRFPLNASMISKWPSDVYFIKR